MVKMAIPVVAYFMLEIITLSFAKCHSGTCKNNPTDDFSLIQGFIESDFAKPLRHAGGQGSHLHSNLEASMNAATTEKPVVKGTKVKANMAGDLPAFLSSVASCSFMFFGCVFAFMIMQSRYPKMLQYRVPANWKDGIAKAGGAGEEYKPEEFKDDDEITSSWFGWARLSLTMKSQEVEQCSGLDAAMLLKFSELAIELMLTFGLPFCILGMPIYAFLGGGFAKNDRLSWPGISNIVWNSTSLTGKPLSKADEDKLMDGQWIFWIVAISTWSVVLWTQHRLFTYQRDFIKRRHQWLKHMSRPRCTTLLVQGIPSDRRNDESFHAFFKEMFPRAEIESSFVMKNVTRSDLPKRWAEKEALEQAINEANFQNNVSEVQSLKDTLSDNMMQILDAQNKFKEEAKTGEHCTDSGFVTFVCRGDTERALGLRMCEDDDEWVFDVPPAPSDVLYHDFEMGEHEAVVYQKLGYAAVAGLFFAFMPLVVGISNISLAIEHVTLIKSILVSTGLKSTADGLLASIGLTIMMCFLPMFLGIIFGMFYELRAARWAQLHMQEYYFWFLVLFVLLVTAIGTNLADTLDALAQSPFKAFNLLAKGMPDTTHFYLKYVILQPVTHGMNLTRYFYVAKYVLFTKVVEVNRARELSEPEDQDYYGMGSRSARFSLMLLIGLVFGTICPLMYVVVLLNFLACRLIYGYLLPFQECRKVDLGGEHWAMQMRHIHQGLIICIVMMTGILLQRAESKGPGVIAAITFLWWFIAYRKFTRALHWERLPYQVVMEDPEGKTATPTGDKYMQSMLEPPSSQFVSGFMRHPSVSKVPDHTLASQLSVPRPTNVGVPNAQTSGKLLTVIS